MPFQVNPALYGNPNGSFDVPAIHCRVERVSLVGCSQVVDGNCQSRIGRLVWERDDGSLWIPRGAG